MQGADSVYSFIIQARDTVLSRKREQARGKKKAWYKGSVKTEEHALTPCALSREGRQGN
jgi:hypothetical protein